MTETSKLVLLAGATGGLGTLITEQLLKKPDVRLRVVVRPKSAAKLAHLRTRGVDVVEIDLEDRDAPLDQIVSGAFSVVSAVQGGPDVIVDAQLRLLEAARRQGVRRLIPSNFSFNIFGLGEGENINSDDRRAFARAAAGARGAVEVVQIQIGAFADRRVLFGFLGAFDLDRGRAFLWGDGAKPMDFTTYQDTARFTAEAAVDEATMPEVFEIAGETMNFHDLVRAYETASGRALRIVTQGTLADLDDAIRDRRQAEPENIFAWLPLMYYRAMLNGKGKLHHIANDRYPHIQPMSVADYVRSEGL